MTSKSARRRRRNQANTPEPPDPEPSEEIDETERMRREMKPGDVLAVLECGDETRREVYANSTIVEVAETVTTQFVTSMTSEGKWPLNPVLVTCYTYVLAGPFTSQYAQFGPFPMDIALSVDAKFLRGD